MLKTHCCLDKSPENLAASIRVKSPRFPIHPLFYWINYEKSPIVSWLDPYIYIYKSPCWSVDFCCFCHQTYPSRLLWLRSIFGGEATALGPLAWEVHLWEKWGEKLRKIGGLAMENGEFPQEQWWILSSPRMDAGWLGFFTSWGWMN